MRLANSKFISLFLSHLVDYPTPSNINIFWGFGSLAGIFLGIQIISGFILTMHYTNNIEHAFFSIEHITRDVNNGWLIRYIHSNGASFYFIILYLHIGRGLYFRSYRKVFLWYSGIIIFVLSMLIGFMGYILPWGQMSYWGATVITNLFTTVPFIGNNIAEWLWGGFSIDNPTLTRFFSIHFLMPFVVLGLVMGHLALLHESSSTDPLIISSKIDLVKFYPKFYHKDLFNFFLIMLFFLSFVFFYPNYLGHADNYIQANALVTPSHIVPEFYFLPFYAILRTIPDKLGGVICMGISIAILFFIPYLGNFKIKNSKHNKLFQFFFWLFIFDFLLLGWLGAQNVEEPFITIGQISTLFYFSYFFLILPILLIVENFFLKKLK